MVLNIFTLLCYRIFSFYKIEKHQFCTPEHTHHWAQCHRKNTHQLWGALWKGRRYPLTVGGGAEEGGQRSSGPVGAGATEGVGQAVWALRARLRFRGFC